MVGSLRRHDTSLMHLEGSNRCQSYGEKRVAEHMSVALERCLRDDPEGRERERERERETGFGESHGLGMF